MVNWGLFTIYVVAAVSLGISMAKHGQQGDKHNFFIDLVAKAISLVLIWWALGWRFI